MVFKVKIYFDCFKNNNFKKYLIYLIIYFTCLLLTIIFNRFILLSFVIVYFLKK